MVVSMRFILAAVVVLFTVSKTIAVTVDHRSLKASLTEAPALKLHVSLKRKAMEIHGQSEFDVFANPVVSSNGASVLYDGYATFLDEGSQLTYSLVNGAAYLATSDSSLTAQTSEMVRCLPLSTLPFNAILPALNDIKPIPSATIGDVPVECKSGNLFKTTFAGIHYAICAADEDGFTAFSSDLTVDVEYLKNPISISPPKLSDGSSCEAVASTTAVTPTALALMTGSTIPKSMSRNLKEAAHLAMEASSCTCKSTPRPCVFFHGLGNEKDEPGLVDSIRHFGWDKIRDRAPCCTTIKYAALNTVDYGWTNSTLQQKVCDRALMATNSVDSPTRSIENTIVVTHSMGGLAFAGALANKECTLGSSSTWIALSPPMTGSMSSDYLMDFCNDEIQGFVPDLLFIGRCPASAATKSVVYKNEKYSTASHDAAYDAAAAVYREKVYAAMCSSSYVGNISKYQAKYMLGGSTIPHKSSKNDGLVEFHSCAGGISPNKFGRTYRDKFYKCELNHVDTAFKTGDGIFKDTVYPVKWFECLL